MNSHQRRKAARAISRNEAFRLYDSRGYMRLIVRWDAPEGQQTFGRHFNKYVARAKVIRARVLQA